jgi:hypothetical protein
MRVYRPNRKDRSEIRASDSKVLVDRVTIYVIVEKRR